MPSAEATQPPFAAHDTSSRAVLRAVDLTKKYKMGQEVVAALRGISFEIPKGQFTSIMGPSGSGKSTLMHILGCLDQPTDGVYELAGQQVQSLSDSELSATRNRFIGFVFQSFNLLPQYDIVRNVELPMVYAGMNTRERRERAIRALERVELGHRLGHKPNELSGGQRQRVAIARALVNDPALLLADEPTGNLDSKTGAAILELFKEIAATGSTIVLVTHEPSVAQHAERIIHLKDGVIDRIEDGTLARSA